MPTTSFHLAFEPVWPWPTVLAVVMALAALVWWTYRPRLAPLPPWTRRTLLGLRFATILLLLFALLRPELRHSSTDDSDAVLVVLTDASRSMSVPDATAGRTRRAALVERLQENASKFETLGKTFEVRVLDFAEVATEVPDGLGGLTEATPGAQTALGTVLENLLRSGTAEQLLGVLLLTDGAQRALPPSDADPRDVARRYGQAALPIYPVPFGGDGAGSAFDLAVEELNVDPVVFEKKAVPVSGRIRIAGGIGRAYTVRLLIEDRTGKRPGESGPMVPATATDNSRPVREISSTEPNAVVPVELSFVPQVPGEFKIALEVVPVEGEVKTTNNRRETIVNVQKGGLRVAYLDVLRPESRWLRNVNTEQKIQLDYVPIRSGLGLGANAGTPDAALFERGKYDAYILGDVPASALGTVNLQLLAARVADGSGLMLLGGINTFGAGGYAGTPLASLLPVSLGSAGQVTEPLAMRPTRAGLTSYIMRLGTEEQNAVLWQQLPPLQGATQLASRGGLVEILAESESGVPLLFTHEVGRARVMAFGGDTTYLWFTAGHQAEHQRFWRQVILWLTRKEFDTDAPVWVLAEPRNIAPAGRVTLSYGARDEKGKPLPDAQFTLEVTSADGKKASLPAAGGAASNSIDYASTQAPGDYWVRAAATNAGRSVGFDAWTRFLVDSRDLELDNPAADPALLAELAALTGGSVIPPEQLSALLARWIADPPGRERLSITRRTPLWDNPWLITAFVACLCVEWYLRKRRGLV